MDAAEQRIAVSDGGRTAFAVTGGPRIGAGGVGADTHARAVEMQDRAAAGGNGVDGQHRCADAHAGDLGVEAAFQRRQVAAGKMRDVGGGAAHVEADDAFAARGERGARGADDAAGGAGEYAVASAETRGVGQSAAGLHEQQAHARQFGAHLLDITAQHRRQVGIGHRGVAARDQFHQRADLVRHRDLGESGLAGQGCGGLLVGRVAVAMHEGDGDRRVATGAGRGQVAAQGVGIRRADDLTAGAAALVNLPHVAVEQLGQHDVAVKDARPVLPGDAQGVGEAAGDEQRHRFAPAFEQCIGGHRRAHAHRVNRIGGNRGVARDAEQVADAGERRVAVTGRVFRQQLVADDAAVRTAGDDVGEGAAAVDPELPASGFV